MNNTLTTTSSLDSNSSYIIYYTFTGILALLLCLVLGGIWSMKRIPCMAKRHTALNITMSFIHFLIAQRSLSTGLEAVSSFGPNATATAFFIDVLIFCALIPTGYALLTIQVLLLINEAYLNHLLMRATEKSSDNLRTQSKIFFTDFDKWFLKLFGLRQSTLKLGKSEQRFIDFSQAGILRALLVIFTFFGLLSVLFTILFLYFLNWDATHISMKWYIAWIWGGAISIVYLFAYYYYLWRAKPIDDPYYIWKEHLVKITIYSLVTLPVFIEILVPPFNQVLKSIGFHTLLFVFVGCTLELILPIVFGSYFIFTTEHRIKGLALNLESFHVMFQDKHMWNEFKKWLAKDFCMENAFFMDEYDRILHQGSTLTRETPKLKQNDQLYETNYFSQSNGNSTIFVAPCNTAMDLYELFLKNNSIYELNISYKAKNAVVEKVNRGNLTMTDLKPVYHEVVHSMFSNTFPRFIRMQKDTQGI